MAADHFGITLGSFCGQKTLGGVWGGLGWQTPSKDIITECKKSWGGLGGRMPPSKDIITEGLTMFSMFPCLPEGLTMFS